MSSSRWSSIHACTSRNCLRGKLPARISPSPREVNGRLELGVFSVNVRQVVALVVDQVQTNDDAVEHGNDGHGVVLLVTYWRQFMQSIVDQGKGQRR